jgi:hypothetical protein
MRCRSPKPAPATWWSRPRDGPLQAALTTKALLVENASGDEEHHGEMGCIGRHHSITMARMLRAMRINPPMTITVVSGSIYAASSRSSGSTGASHFTSLPVVKY